ncbi:MAG: type II toxin-antitoxin system RelE/ParE family toxin [Devosia sp.]|nr:type II toxin-antitoxin system RelE/ParE family toxin [Devosia sp.]
MRIFKVKLFARFARREGIGDGSLREAVARAMRGLIDADLGGGVIKQRVARPGAGRSGGFRTLLAFRAGDVAVFLYGFAKSDRGNITDEELDYLRSIAGQWLTDPRKIDKDAKAGILIEVEDDDEN